MWNIVSLDRVQKPLCANESNSTPKLLPPPPKMGYICNDTPSKRPPSLSQQGWSVLGPAARILKGGVDAVNATVLQLRDGLTGEERAAKVKDEERRLILKARMKGATKLEQWQKAAVELDILEDNEAWKRDLNCDEFDVDLVESRLKQLDEARTDCDVRAMMGLVRQALARDLGGMGNVRLYKHSHIGTKDLIERYIDSTLATIRSLVETSKHTLPDGIEAKDILDQVVCARQAFGRSALLLSGGATFGMNHIGVLKALFEAKLLPRIISGTSAGSIVCAVLCTRTDEEIPAVLNSFPYGDLSVFEPNGNEDSVMERIRRLLTKGAWIDISHLSRVMKDMLGDMTFQEAYNRTRRILNITVSSASVYELPRLLNYVTAPNVMIWSAVAASCSVPLIFNAGELLVKNPVTGLNTPWNPTPQRWIDGSVEGDLPMTRLAEMFNVNSFIVSQVNPHVVPFLIKGDEAITKETSGSDPGSGWVHALTNLAKDEALHRMHVLTEMGIFPNLVTKARSILSQKYSGDITILPAIEYKDFPRILKNPTADFMVSACLCGERATWPKLSRIRNHCAVELELDAAVQQLRARVVFSPSQVDLRRMTTGSRIQPNRPGHRRRDSGSNVRPFRSLEDPKVHVEKKNALRTSVRVGHPHWGTKSFLPPGPHTAHVDVSHGSRHYDREVNPFAFLGLKQDVRKESIPFPELSSAGDTTSHSPPSSDADVDSHTDDSSPELNPTTDLPELGFHYDPSILSAGTVIDFFSASQPVTSGTDRILATSPLSSRGAFGIAVTSSKENGRPDSTVTPASIPERKRQQLFHPPPTA